MRVVPYSVRSFKALAERESRRGADISRTVPAVRSAVTALRDRRDQYRTEIAFLAQDSPERLAARDQFRSDREELRQRRDDAVENAMQGALIQFEQALSSGDFTFDLEPGVNLDGRQTYRVSDALCVAFPEKQAAAVIRKLGHGDAQGRNGIIRALKEALGKRYAHAIYRLDIQSFFDSVPHDKLLSALRSVSRLDTVTSDLVSRLLEEFASITGQRKGLPQGVAMSSHLADFYLHGLDRRVKTAPGVLFYARYVDDLVLVLEDEEALAAVQRQIDEELRDLGLTKHPLKTKPIITTANGDYPEGQALEYLGYRFTRAEGALSTGLTATRHQRRVIKLESALQRWLDSSPSSARPNHGQDGLLIDRLRYLAGNTKLLNSKDNVAIGLFFSNSALDPGAPELIELDDVLQQFVQANTDKMSEGLRKKISAISFVEMFIQRPFYRFDQQKVQRIVQAWRDGAR